GLKDELDEAWAARPLELVRDGDRAMLVLEEPGGLLRSLREEFHHHRRELGGHFPYPIAGRDWLSRKVAMDQFDWIGRGEGEPASQQLVESDSQSVEVTPGIDRSIHPTGLFRRHIGERPGYPPAARAGGVHGFD